MIKDISLERQEGGVNYRVKWQSHFSILRAPRALNTENTVINFSNSNVGPSNLPLPVVIEPSAKQNSSRTLVSVAGLHGRLNIDIRFLRRIFHGKSASWHASFTRRSDPRAQVSRLFVMDDKRDVWSDLFRLWTPPGIVFTEVFIVADLFTFRSEDNPYTFQRQDESSGALVYGLIQLLLEQTGVDPNEVISWRSSVSTYGCVYFDLV